MIELYTDGSTLTNPGPGGWAALLMEGDSVREMTGTDPATTNNRMEMMGVIEGLRTTPYGAEVKVYSDSAYVVNCFLQKWYVKWKRNGWVNSAGKSVENKDLWETLLGLVRDRQVEFIKVKGHASNEFNNRCDELAGIAVRREYRIQEGK